MLNFKSGIGSIFFLLIYIVAVWTIDKWGLIFAGLLALIVAVIIVKKKMGQKRIFSACIYPTVEHEYQYWRT